jgi:hypothetical protein
MSDKINNSEIDYSNNQLSEQAATVELTSNAEPIEQVAPVELTNLSEPIEQVAPVELTNPSEPIEQVAVVELTINAEPIEQVAPVELTNLSEPIEQVAPVELTSPNEPSEQVAPVELTSPNEPSEQAAIVELTSNVVESIEIIEHVKPIIEEKVAVNNEPIKITIDIKPTESILIPNNIEPPNISIISGSDDVIKTIKTNLIVLEQESKQEKIVSSIELEEVNNNKMQCCFFFQYPKWRK